MCGKNSCFMLLVISRCEICKEILNLKNVCLDYVWVYYFSCYDRN